jgi:hypothetical protein
MHQQVKGGNEREAMFAPFGLANGTSKQLFHRILDIPIRDATDAYTISVNSGCGFFNDGECRLR